jgi:nucleoid-associated protein YgaU
MYEVTCFHCGHLAHISPDIERCAVCGADLRHLITPEYGSRYFYERAAEMAAAGEGTLALLEVERGIAYRASSELYLLAAILAQRLGDQAQVRRYVSAIPVDDVLRPEAEWLLRSQQSAIRSMRETRNAAYAAAAAPPAPPVWLANEATTARPLPRPTAVRTNPILYGVVAVGLLLLVGWLTFRPITAAWQQIWQGDAGVAQATPTAPSIPPATPAAASDATLPAESQVPAPTATPTPEIPSNLVQPAGTPEPLAAASPAGLAGGDQYDLKGYLALTNRPELAELEVSAVLEGTKLKLQGIVPLYDYRQSIIELAQRAPNISEVDAVNLLIRLPATYTVQSGDSLWLISYKLYGRDRVADLFAANRDVLPSAEALAVGQTLQVPPNP